MVSVIFDTLLSGGAITVTVPSVVYGTDYSDQRYAQHSLRTGDGNLVVYDGAGKNVVDGSVIMKGVSTYMGEDFKIWLRDEAVFGLNKFTITPPALLDLGLGRGVPVINCNFMKDNDAGVFKYVVPGVYKVNFPYSFVRI